MALQANITLDLNKKNTTNPRVQLRQSDQNYPSITVQVTENGQPFNGTTWEAAFEGMTSSGKFVHDSSHFDNSTTPATGTYTYVPPLQVSSDVGTFELAYLVFEKAGSPKQRTTTANFRFDIIEQADINAGVAKDYVSTWQSADAKMKALQKSMEDAAAAYKGTVDAYVKDFGNKVNNINRDITAAEKRITDMVNEANAALQNILKSNNTFTGTNTFNNQVSINETATIHQIELMSAAPYIDFHGKNSTADYTTRLIDAGQGLLSTTQEGRRMDLSIHIANDANPVNVDTMTGGAPDLGYGGDLHTIVVSGGGTKNLTGTLPAGNKMPYSVLENIPGTSSATSYQKWTDFTSNKTYIRSYSGNPAKWSAWKQLAYDDEVVHNTGNETIAGVKGFTDNLHMINSKSIYFDALEADKLNVLMYATHPTYGDQPILRYMHYDKAGSMVGISANGTTMIGGGESVLSFMDILNTGGAKPAALAPITPSSEQLLLASDGSVVIHSGYNAGGTTGATWQFDAAGNLQQWREGKWEDRVTSSGTVVSSPTPILAKVNLNNYATSGEYYTPTNEIAGSVSNGITDPSTQSGKSFHLTVDKATDGSRVYQTLRTYEGWVFTRNFDRGASTWTPWLAQSGTMNTTIKGPHSSTIKLSRSGNLVYAHIGGFKSGEALYAGGVTIEKIPADYLPISFATSVPEAVIRTRWDQQALVVLSNGTLKNYGGGAFNSDGEGSWLVHGETIS